VGQGREKCPHSWYDCRGVQRMEGMWWVLAHTAKLLGGGPRDVAKDAEIQRLRAALEEKTVALEETTAALEERDARVETLTAERAAAAIGGTSSYRQADLPETCIQREPVSLDEILSGVPQLPAGLRFCQLNGPRTGVALREVEDCQPVVTRAVDAVINIVLQGEVYCVRVEVKVSGKRPDHPVCVKDDDTVDGAAVAVETKPPENMDIAEMQARNYAGRLWRRGRDILAKQNEDAGDLPDEASPTRFAVATDCATLSIIRIDSVSRHDWEGGNKPVLCRTSVRVPFLPSPAKQPTAGVLALARLLSASPRQLGVVSEPRKTVDVQRDRGRVRHELRLLRKRDPRDDILLHRHYPTLARHCTRKHESEYWNDTNHALSERTTCATSVLRVPQRSPLGTFSPRFSTLCTMLSAPRHAPKYPSGRAKCVT
jgi:hypothetical protein